MGIITTQDMKAIVRDFGVTTLEDGDWYFIVKKEFADGIKAWLEGYTYSDDGHWLRYSLQPSKNETEVYILRLYVE